MGVCRARTDPVTADGREAGTVRPAARRRCVGHVARSLRQADALRGTGIFPAYFTVSHFNAGSGMFCALFKQSQDNQYRGGATWTHGKSGSIEPPHPGGGGVREKGSIDRTINKLS